MKNLYLLFPIAVIAFFAMLFFSFRNVEDSFTVEGKVVDSQNQPVFNAIVLLDKAVGQEVSYFEPTDVNGNFKLKFNAVEGKPLKIHIQKEYFLQVVEQIIPTSAKKNYDLVIALQRDKSTPVEAAPSPNPSLEKPISAASMAPPGR